VNLYNILSSFSYALNFFVWKLMLPSFSRLMIEGSGKTWKQDQRIRLHHVDTNGYLHSHDKRYQRIAGGQQEVHHR
jgi:dolichyl-phosphate-mannose--protein O-mannosyl transferase